MTPQPLTHISLCSGIGGADLAAEAAGFSTIVQCEIDPFCRQVLRHHFPDAGMWYDIRDITAEDIHRETHGVHPTLITAGFPCQPFSIAGKRRGKDDDRYLWDEVARIVQLARPDWFVAENVANAAGMVFATAASDLADLGYVCDGYIIPACAVGAPHRRDRLFIVAHFDGVRHSAAETVARRLSQKNGEVPRSDDTARNEGGGRTCRRS